MFIARMHRSLAWLALPALLCATLAAEGAPPLPEDLSGFQHIHSFVITDENSPLFGFHHFYGNQKALEALERGGPYPAGSEFLGVVYEVESGQGQVNEGQGVAYTLMRREPEAEATGGWRFAQYRADGSYIEQDEATACFQCHTRVEDRHYVFSEPLEGLRLPAP